MNLDSDRSWKAIEARDIRYDGWVYCSVKTTGVFCRPSCPARTPKRENVRLFSAAAAARAAGFRPCKRCRPDSTDISLRLPCRTPFDGAGLISFLARRAVPGVEEVTDGTYRRSLALPHGPATLELKPAKDHVTARYRLSHLRDLAVAVERSRNLLDLDSDPQVIAEALSEQPALGELVQAAPGRRVPGSVDSHELAVRAVLGQQVTLRVAATLAAQLVAGHGQELDRPLGSVTHLFPSTEALATADLGRALTPASRLRALKELACALHRGDARIDSGADRDLARRTLLALRGIGPWTVGYIAMRAMRDPDVFLPTDVGVRRGLEQLGLPADPAGAGRLAERWRPYRSYAVQHLWASLASTASRPEPAVAA